MGRQEEGGGPAPDQPLPALPDVVCWESAGRVLLLRPGTGRWLISTPTGAEVVKLCDGRRRGRDVAAVLAARYGLDPARAEADVRAFACELDRAGFLSPPLAVSPPSLEGVALHLTSRCALRCRHCYGSPGTPGAPEPSVALLRSAVEQARALGARSFKLTGGDPLCRPEAISGLREPLAGTTVTVLTAGLAPCDELRALLQQPGWLLQVSLDGADAAVHDWFRGAHAFDRLTANLNALAQMGLARRVRLSTCLARANHHQIEAIVGLALDWGVYGLHLVRVSRQGRAARHWAELDLTDAEWCQTYAHLAELHSRYRTRLLLTGFLSDYLASCVGHPTTRGCPLGRQVMVDLDGRVYPCIMMTRPEDCLGNLNRESLASCLASERLARLREACAARLTDQAGCGACDWRLVCRGACPGWPVAQGRRLEDRDELCALRRELLPRLILSLSGPAAGGETPCPT